MWDQAWVDSVRVSSGNGAIQSRVLCQGGVLILDVACTFVHIDARHERMNG